MDVLLLGGSFVNRQATMVFFLGKCAQTVRVLLRDRWHQMNSRCRNLVDGSLGPKRFQCVHESDYYSSHGHVALTSGHMDTDLCYPMN